MKRKKLITFCLVASLLMFFLLELSINEVWCAEEKYPSRTIEMICGFAPGGQDDLTTRVLAKAFERYFKVPAVVTNKAGGAQLIAATALANAVPDGYTLAHLGDVSLVTHILLKRATFTIEDFTVIGEMDQEPPTLVVSAESPWKRIDEFIDYARKNPDLGFGHPGVGSSPHLRGEYFNKLAKTNMKGVPFKGDSECIVAVLGKHIPMAVLSFASAKAQEKAGKMRILFAFDYAGEDRFDPTIPNIPSFFGKDVFNIGPVSDYLVAPGKLPENIVNILTQAMVQIPKEDKEYIDALKPLYIGTTFIDGKTWMSKIRPQKTLQIQRLLQEVGVLK